MSLLNDYLKRIGKKSSPQSNKRRWEVPPVLQRMQEGAVQPTLRKKYLRFVGIGLAVYCVGYFLVSVISMFQHSVNNQAGVAVQHQTQNTAPALTDTVTQTTTGEPLIEEKMPGSVVELNETKKSGNLQEHVVATPIAVTDATAKREPQAGVDVNKVVSATKDLQPDQVTISEETMRTSSGVLEEPYPLTGTEEEKRWSSTTPSKPIQTSSSKVVFTESKNKPAYFYQIALQAQHNNNFGRAERYYREVLQKEPGHENALVNLAAIYIQEKRLQEAQSLLDRAIKVNPENSKALVNAGMIALQQNKDKVASDFFRQALQYNPIEETALINLAYLAVREKKYDEAGSYYAKLTRVSPEKIDILLVYAGLEEKKKEYSSAVDLYRRCLDQMSMQKQPELYEKIKQRIQLLRQYASQQAYKDFFKVE